MGRSILALACAIIIVLCAYEIHAANRGIGRERVVVGGTPVEIFRPSGGGSEPAVVVAHGFSGSRQIMYAIGYTLAHNGYVAALLDFPGHGRNLTPMNQAGTMRNVTQLTDALDGVVQYARARDDIINDQVALLGHSMGTAVVMTYGLNHADIEAAVALSAILTDITPSMPRNLLLLTGNLEFGNLKQNALAALQNGGGQDPGVLYGDFAQGTARRLEFVPGTEHVTILFNRQSLAWIVDWLNAVFGRTSSGWTDSRIVWVLALYAAALALYFPLSRWVWRRHSPLRGHRIGFGHLLLFAGVPALLTPLVLRLVSPLTEFIPLLVADYLAVYFFLAGIGTLILLRWRGLLERRVWRGWIKPGCVGAGLVLFGYIVLAVFIPGDLTWASMMPTGQRVLWFLALSLLCFPYFLADTSLTYARGRGQTLWRFLLTKVIFLGSMMLALQLSPGLFFILLLLPFLLLAWAMFGVYATRATARLGSPVPGAIAMALAFAWFMASLFPLA
jgi:pimeloyl-ACP methyl ester carboxylesterase